jgi:phosphoribosylaminoimidazole-succinocarboxamide synthase
MSDPIIEGSSKRFYARDNGVLLMTFKDDIHGANQADVIEGTGDLRRRFSYAFYCLLERQGIRTHLVRPIESALVDRGIAVRRAFPIKIEILVRNVARGYWVDGHKVPVFPSGVAFSEPIVELCLKGKVAREDGTIVDDPRISPGIAVALNASALDVSVRGHMLECVGEAVDLELLARKINGIYQSFLRDQGWTLEDFKFEVGLDPDLLGRSFMLIDEISPDCSRIRDANENSLSKDLFRQRRPHDEIRAAYLRLTEAVERAIV